MRNVLETTCLYRTDVVHILISVSPKRKVVRGAARRIISRDIRGGGRLGLRNAAKNFYIFSMAFFSLASISFFVFSTLSACFVLLSLVSAIREIYI